MFHTCARGGCESFGATFAHLDEVSSGAGCYMLCTCGLRGLLAPIIWSRFCSICNRRFERPSGRYTATAFGAITGPGLKGVLAATRRPFKFFGAIAAGRYMAASCPPICLVSCPRSCPISRPRISLSGSRVLLCPVMLAVGKVVLKILKSNNPSEGVEKYRHLLRWNRTVREEIGSSAKGLMRCFEGQGTPKLKR